MSDTAIFVIGLFTFFLLGGGVVYTFTEVHKLYREDIKKPGSK